MGDDDSGLVLNLFTPTNAVHDQRDHVFTASKERTNPRHQKTLEHKRKKLQHHGRFSSSRQSKPLASHDNENETDSSGGFSFNFSETQKKSSGKRTGDGDGKERQQTSSSGIISSLFRHNPDIPQVRTHSVTQQKEAVFSSTHFKDLPLHSFMISNLEKNLGVDQMTTIQQRAIPTILQGKDTLVKSQTGTGKTLAYAVPVVQQLQALQTKIQRLDGPYAVVLVPTRELALQSFDTMQKLVKPFHWIVPGCLMGGEKKKSEKARIRKGINILVSTPGRLVDHISTTQSLSFTNVQFVVLDEADRLLDMGFEKDVSSILNAISDQAQAPKQTVLVSATLSEGVKRLASITLRDPVFIDVAKNQSETAKMAKDSSTSLPSAASASSISSSELEEPSSGQDGKSDEMSDTKHRSKIADQSEEESGNFTMPERLKQQFVIVPSKLRLVTLIALVAGKFKNPSGCKMLVFLSSRESVEFHYTLFQACLGCSTLQGDGSASQKDEGLPLFRLHGSMSQGERTMMYQGFSSARTGLLLCTDVAARGLDLPKVKWIVQYNTPGSPSDYVHRVGRTARIGKEGHALLFLSPSEVDYVKVLEEQNISITEQALDTILSSLLKPDAQGFIHGRVKGQMQRSVEEAATSIQLRLENHLLSNGTHMQQARRAFHSFVRAYATYPSSLKGIFHVKKLHLGHVAKSFGLREAPSNIGNRIGSNNNSSGRGMKRKKGNFGTRAAAVSEFDSGLDDAGMMDVPKKIVKRGGGGGGGEGGTTRKRMRQTPKQGKTKNRR